MYCKILKWIPTVSAPVLGAAALAWFKVFWGEKEAGEWGVKTLRERMQDKSLS